MGVMATAESDWEQGKYGKNIKSSFETMRKFTSQTNYFSGL